MRLQNNEQISALPAKQNIQKWYNSSHNQSYITEKMTLPHNHGSEELSDYNKPESDLQNAERRLANVRKDYNLQREHPLWHFHPPAPDSKQSVVHQHIPKPNSFLKDDLQYKRQSKAYLSFAKIPIVLVVYQVRINWHGQILLHTPYHLHYPLQLQPHLFLYSSF